MPPGHRRGVVRGQGGGPVRGAPGGADRSADAVRRDEDVGGPVVSRHSPGARRGASLRAARTAHAHLPQPPGAGPRRVVTVRIGLGLFTGQIPPGSDRTFRQEYHDVVELTRLAETLGFDSAWVSEHHGSSDAYLPSLLPMLAAMAAATDRVQLGTGVMLVPFHDPLRLAEDAAVVDQISGGRLILGLGLGWREEEFRMFDVPVRERVSRTSETVQILRKAWTGDRFSHDGRMFRFDAVKVTPAPARVPGPPIYLGGFVEEAVRPAGGVGAGDIRRP